MVGFDRRGLAETLARAYLDQIFVYGFIHADPHPGNILLTPDGRLGLVDLGMVTYVTPTRQEQMLKLLAAASEGQADEVAKILMEIGTPSEDRDEAHFTEQAGSLVMLNKDVSLQQMQFGRLVVELIRIATQNGIKPAPELSMLGKALLNLDEASRILDPDFRPNELVRDQIQAIMSRHMLGVISPGNVLSTIMDLYDFVGKLPGRMNLILDKLTKEQFEIRVHAFDEVAFFANMQKIANRITVGLILAALIIGAALMMQVHTTFTLFGYPGIAVVMFLLAAFLGLFVVGRILFDEARKH